MRPRSTNQHLQKVEHLIVLSVGDLLDLSKEFNETKKP